MTPQHGQEQKAKTIQELVKNALTAASEPQTKVSPRNTKAWAEWLKFDTHGDRQLEGLADACAEMTLAIKEGLKPRWLSILGTTGTGKSHCARKVWQFARTHLNWSGCCYISNTNGQYWPSEVDALRSGGHYEQFYDMQRWPVLYLDDIGAERDSTGFAADKLNTLVGCRDERWTIITSNLMLEQLAAIEPRIADRIIRKPNIFIEITTKSHALR